MFCAESLAAEAARSRYRATSSLVRVAMRIADSPFTRGPANGPAPRTSVHRQAEVDLASRDAGVAAGQNSGTLQHVLELAYVAGPVVLAEFGHRGRIELLHRLVAAHLLQEMAHEQWKVVHVIGERRGTNEK